MKHNYRILFLTLYLYCFLSGSAVAQTMRFASFDSIMKSIPSYQKAVNTMNKKMRAYQNQVKKMDQEYSEKLDFFTNKYPNDVVTIKKGDLSSLKIEVAKEYDILQKNRFYKQSNQEL